LSLPAAAGVPFLDPDVEVRIKDLEAAEKSLGLKVEEGDVLLDQGSAGTRRRDVVPTSTPEGRRNSQASMPSVSTGFTTARSQPSAAMACAIRCQAACATITGPIPIPYVRAGRHGSPPSSTTWTWKIWPWLRPCREALVLPLTIAPLRIEGGTGSPVNPIALF
jgi:hypothetical protein